MGDAFRLVLLKQTWQGLHLGYECEPALERLGAASREDPLMVVELDDLEAYRSSSASLVLTVASSQRLATAILQGIERRDEGLEALVELKKSLGWGNPIERALYTRAFVVLSGEHYVYGGIFLDPPSQMAINYPVARVTLDDGRVVFSLLPLHLPFINTDPAVDPSAGQGRGPMGDVPASMMGHFVAAASAPPAVANRRRMLDPRLLASIEAAGKWQLVRSWRGHPDLGPPIA